MCGAGIGHIGIVDYDTVELSNLHRQIVHAESSIGIPKSVSIKEHLTKLNSTIKVTAYQEQLNSQNALEIIKDYDIILDATDNVATRYLLNDACVFSSKPLVSGSALQFEGQLTVYNYRNGPCYRCLFPRPPPPETVHFDSFHSLFFQIHDLLLIIFQYSGNKLWRRWCYWRYYGSDW